MDIKSIYNKATGFARENAKRLPTPIRPAVEKGLDLIGAKPEPQPPSRRRGTRRESASR
jgi:hypothetical protein